MSAPRLGGWRPDPLRGRVSGRDRVQGTGWNRSYVDAQARSRTGPPRRPDVDRRRVRAVRTAATRRGSPGRNGTRAGTAGGDRPGGRFRLAVAGGDLPGRRWRLDGGGAAAWAPRTAQRPGRGSARGVHRRCLVDRPELAEPAGDGRDVGDPAGRDVADQAVLLVLPVARHRPAVDQDEHPGDQQADPLVLVHERVTGDQRTQQYRGLLAQLAICRPLWTRGGQLDQAAVLQAEGGAQMVPGQRDHLGRGQVADHWLRRASAAEWDTANTWPSSPMGPQLRRCRYSAMAAITTDSTERDSAAASDCRRLPIGGGKESNRSDMTTAGGMVAPWMWGVFAHYGLRSGRGSAGAGVNCPSSPDRAKRDRKQVEPGHHTGNARGSLYRPRGTVRGLAGAPQREQMGRHHLWAIAAVRAPAGPPPWGDADAAGPASRHRFPRRCRRPARAAGRAARAAGRGAPLPGRSVRPAGQRTEPHPGRGRGDRGRRVHRPDLRAPRRAADRPGRAPAGPAHLPRVRPGVALTGHTRPGDRYLVAGPAARRGRRVAAGLAAAARCAAGGASPRWVAHRGGAAAARRGPAGPPAGRRP